MFTLSVFNVFMQYLSGFIYLSTNPSNEDYEMFDVKEVFKCHERGWYEKIKEGKKLKLGDSQWNPKKYSRSIKRQSLGMPKASPSSSTKLSGRVHWNYGFIASSVMWYSWSVILFCFQFFLFFLVIILLDPIIVVWERDMLHFFIRIL